MKHAAQFVILFLSLSIGFLHATPTKVVVRALAKDAKFIGTSMGGALVVIRAAESGEVLARGYTSGGTGDTRKLMQEPFTRGMQLSNETAAKYEITLDLTEPLFVTVEVYAPMAQRQSMVMGSTQLWLIPGKNITGDGILIEIPGFSVDILSPQAHQEISLAKVPDGIPIRINLAMMCGCPVSPGGVWDSAQYEITALISRDGHVTDTIPLTYAGQASTFEGVFKPAGPGIYEITAYAFDAQHVNTGLDKTTVIVSE
ncbi:MAG: hypothetical protein P8184_02100 [Calditrichia bacterium]